MVNKLSNDEYLRYQEVLIGYFFRGGSKEAMIKSVSLLREIHFEGIYSLLWRVLSKYFAKTGVVMTIAVFREYCRTVGKLNEMKIAEFETQIQNCISKTDAILKNDNDIYWYIGRIGVLYQEISFRNAIEKGLELLNQKGYGHGKDFILQRISQLDSYADEIYQDGTVGDGIKSVVTNAEKALAERHTLAVDLGIPSLDVEICGLRGGDVVFIVGFTGVGKTISLINIGINIAYHQKKNVVYITTETSREQILRRVVSRISKIDVFSLPILEIKLKSGDLSVEEKDILKQIQNYILMPEHGVFYIAQAPASATLEWVKGRLLDLESKFHVDVLLLDDLRCIKPLVRRKSEWEEFNELIKDFKAIARCHSGRGIPVISPYQVSRESYKEALQNGGHYELTALSSSSEAERVSDVVFSLWSNEENPGELRGEILKMREGRKGKVFKIRFDPRYQFLEEIIDLNTLPFGF